MHTHKTVTGKKKLRFTQDTVFDIIVAAILSIIILIMAYPILFRTDGLFFRSFLCK